jgi:hypothetical protein
MAGMMTGAAATRHVGRVTKTDEFFLSEAVEWVYATVPGDLECVNDLALRS